MAVTRIFDGTFESNNFTTEGFEPHPDGVNSQVIVQMSNERVAHGTLAFKCMLNRANLGLDTFRAELYCRNNEGNQLAWNQEYWLGLNIWMDAWASDSSPEFFPLQVHRRPSSWDTTLNNGLGCGGNVSAWSVAPFYNAIQNNRLLFHTMGGVTRASVPVVTGQWHSIVYRFVLSYTSSGLIEAWYNNTKLFAITGANHDGPLDDCNQPWRQPYLNFGIYKWDWKVGKPATQTSLRRGYIDDIRLYKGTDGYSTVYFPASGSPPADTTPPTISSISITNITQTSVTVTWVTNEAATSRVDWWQGTNPATNLSTSNLVTAHSKTITGLASGTTYNFNVRSSDAASNQRISANSTFTTQSSDIDTAPPVLSNIVANSTETTITVSWLTDEPATTRLKFLSPITTSSFDATLVNSHSVTMTGLNPGTLFTYKLDSVDESGNLGSVQNLTVSTKAVVPPVISGIDVAPTAIDLTIIWTTDKPCTSVLHYGATTSYGSTISNTNLKTDHSAVITGLSNNQAINFKIVVTDSFNFSSESPNQTAETLALSSDISNVQIALSANQAVITFDTSSSTQARLIYDDTSKLAYEFGGITTIYGFVTPFTANGTSHSITLTELEPNKVYFFKIQTAFIDESKLSGVTSFVSLPNSGIIADQFD